MGLTSKRLRDLDAGSGLQPSEPGSPCSAVSVASTSVGTGVSIGSTAASNPGSCSNVSIAPIDTGRSCISRDGISGCRTDISWSDVVCSGLMTEATEALRICGPPQSSSLEPLVSSACLNPHCAYDMVQFLVERCHLDPTAADENRQTPLFYAARSGHARCAEFLLSKGLDPNHVDLNMQSPLYYAARDGHSALIRCLVVGRADVNHLDRYRETPLFWAKDRASSATLLDMRADPRLLSKQKLTAAAAADITGDHDRARLLKDFVRLLPPRMPQRPEYGHLFGRGKGYIVRQGELADLEQLVALEQEFVDDHAAIFDPAGSYDRQVWSNTMGVKGDIGKRREVISAILKAGAMPLCGQRELPMRWTLVCHCQASHEVVGFVHYSLEGVEENRARGADGQPLTRYRRRRVQPDGPKSLHIGYLKVARSHTRLGVAGLLLSAVPKHLAKIAERTKRTHPQQHAEWGGCEPFARQAELSVAEQNQKAVSLYCKFGFERDLEPSVSVVKGVKVRWCKMVRTSQNSLAELVANLDALVVREQAGNFGDLRC